MGSQLLAGEVFPWQQKVVFFSGVVDGFLVVENTMTFFFFPDGLGEQIWWWLEFVGCGGCLCLEKFGVGLKGLDAFIPSRCYHLGISVTARRALSSNRGIHRSFGVDHDFFDLGLFFHVGVGLI